MGRIYNDMCEAIGGTPLVRTNKMSPNPEVEILAKLEKNNPTGSVKDRIAKYMIEAGEKSGQLTKHKIVIEPTSGNTGIGLAMVCAVKGYPLMLVMPETMSMERRKTLTAFGAKIVLSPGDKGMNGAEDMAREMAEAQPERYFRPNQFFNEANVQSHYETTGREILEDTGGEVDAFVAGIGTSGTLMGVSRRLKEVRPDIRIIAVEPKPKTKIQGLKNLETQYVPGIYDPSRIDEKIHVEDEDAFETARLLTLQEGMFCGISSGANMWGAIQVAKRMKKGRIVVVLPDGGERYISTQLFDPAKCLACIQRCKEVTCITPDYIESIEKWYSI
jgi:cysteine synthase B